MKIEEAYEKWADDLGRYATVLVGPDEAVDVVAEALTTILASGRWSSVSNPKSYLMTAVLNAARMRIRSSKRRRAREIRVAVAEATVDLHSDLEVRQRLEALTANQRAVIYLTYWEDMTPSAIAVVMGTTEGTVKRQLARARVTLRKVLHDESD